MAAEQSDEPRAPTPQDNAAPPKSGGVEGHVDALNERRIAGWAFDRARPDAALKIEIHHRGERLSQARADQLRADLQRVGVGDGRHAFEIIFDPPLLKEVSERVLVLARSADGEVLAPLSGPIAKPQAPALTGPQPVKSGVPSAAPGEAIRVLRRDIDAAFRSFVREIRATLNESCGRSAADAEALTSMVADIAARQEALAQQIAVFEVFQARFDATLTASESIHHKTGSARAPDRGLRIAIAGLAMLSATSLVIGLLSIWR